MGLVEEGRTLGSAGDLDDVGCVAAAGSLGMERVDRATFECRDRVLDEAGLVQRVGVDAHLHIHLVRNGERGTQHRRRGAPVLVTLQADCAGLDLLDQRRLAMPVPLAENAHIDGPAFESAQHRADVARSRCDGGGIGAVRRAGAPANQGGGAVGQRRVGLLRRDEMNMGVDAGGGEDQMRAGDRVGGQARIPGPG